MAGLDRIRLIVEILLPRHRGQRNLLHNHGMAGDRAVATFLVFTFLGYRKNALPMAPATPVGRP